MENNNINNDYARAYFEKFVELLQASEGRIDRINDMVKTLAKATENISNTFAEISKVYCEQIASLADCRNDLTRQNVKLLDILRDERTDINALRAEIKSERDRIYRLIDKIAEGGRGVKIENQITND